MPSVSRVLDLLGWDGVNAMEGGRQRYSIYETGGCPSSLLGLLLRTTTDARTIVLSFTKGTRVQ